MAYRSLIRSSFDFFRVLYLNIFFITCLRYLTFQDILHYMLISLFIENPHIFSEKLLLFDIFSDFFSAIRFLFKDLNCYWGYFLLFLLFLHRLSTLVGISPQLFFFLIHSPANIDKKQLICSVIPYLCA